MRCSSSGWVVELPVRTATAPSGAGPAARRRARSRRRAVERRVGADPPSTPEPARTARRSRVSLPLERGLGGAGRGERIKQARVFSSDSAAFRTLTGAPRPRRVADRRLESPDAARHRNRRATRRCAPVDHRPPPGTPACRRSLPHRGCRRPRAPNSRIPPPFRLAPREARPGVDSRAAPPARAPPARTTPEAWRLDARPPSRATPRFRPTHLGRPPGKLAKPRLSSRPGPPLCPPRRGRIVVAY